MKLILTQEIDGLGTPGDIVEVKDGYGRNYLLPRGFAVAWTKGAEKQISAIRKARKAREVKSLEEAKSFKAALEAKTVKVAVRSGAGGRLFGAVTAGDIVTALSAAGGPSVDRRKVEIAKAIKTVGKFGVTVRLHADVLAKVSVEVVPA